MMAGSAQSGENNAQHLYIQLIHCLYAYVYKGMYLQYFLSINSAVLPSFLSTPRCVSAKCELHLMVIDVQSCINIIGFKSVQNLVGVLVLC